MAIHFTLMQNALSTEVLLGNAKGSGRAPQSTYINDCDLRVRWSRSMTLAYPARPRHFDEKLTVRPSDPAKKHQTGRDKIKTECLRRYLILLYALWRFHPLLA